MAFGVNRAICVARQLLSWLIVLCAPGETYLRDISLQTKQTVTPRSLHFYCLMTKKTTVVQTDSFPVIFVDYKTTQLKVSSLQKI